MMTFTFSSFASRSVPLNTGTPWTEDDVLYCASTRNPTHWIGLPCGERLDDLQVAASNASCAVYSNPLHDVMSRRS